MTANELFLKHAADHLAQYKGNLRLLCEAVESGVVPDAADQSMHPYVEQLKRHLADAGASEDDDFLLRFALIVPGRMRGIHPPVAVFSPDRGGFSPRRLQEAAGQITRLREALHLGRRFLGNLSSDTLTAFRKLTE